MPQALPSVVLHVKVVPGSSRNRVAGRYGEGIKVQVSAAAERGKANAAVIDVLAEALGVSRAGIELITGPANPRKQFRIYGLTPQLLQAKLENLP